MMIMGTKTFVLEDSLKKQGLKILEEASEAQVAACEYEKAFTKYEKKYWKGRLREELADVMQTVFNTYDALGLKETDLLDDMTDCYERNISRGRVE